MKFPTVTVSASRGCSPDETKWNPGQWPQWATVFPDSGLRPASGLREI